MSYKKFWGCLNSFFLWVLCGFYMSPNAASLAYCITCSHSLPSNTAESWSGPIPNKRQILLSLTHGDALSLLACTLDPGSDQNQLRRSDNYIGWAPNIYTNQSVTLVSTRSHSLSSIRRTTIWDTQHALIYSHATHMLMAHSYNNNQRQDNTAIPLDV